MRAEIDEVRRQLAQVPPEVVVANHVMGLYELAAIHLSQDPPNAAGAALAIDGMGALVEGLAGRLGEAEPTLRDALSQMRLVFVQVTGFAAEHDLPVPDLDALRSQPSRVLGLVPGHEAALRRDHPPPGPIGIDRGQQPADGPRGARVARLLRDLAIRHDLAGAKPPEHRVDAVLERRGHSEVSSAGVSGGRNATTCCR